MRRCMRVGWMMRRDAGRVEGLVVVARVVSMYGTLH